MLLRALSWSICGEGWIVRCGRNPNEDFVVVHTSETVNKPFITERAPSIGHKTPSSADARQGNGVCCDSQAE